MWRRRGRDLGGSGVERRLSRHQSHTGPLKSAPLRLYGSAGKPVEAPGWRRSLADADAWLAAAGAGIRRAAAVREVCRGISDTLDRYRASLWA